MMASSSASMSASSQRGAVGGIQKFSALEFSTYVAFEARVQMVPRFSLPAVPCISGTYGPFTPNYPVVVPLWLALYFRQTDTCTLNPPAFLSAGYLQDLLRRENLTDSTFELLHFHFFEIAKLFFDFAPDDVPDVDEVMRLIPEVLARRREKILQSIGLFRDPAQTLRVPALKVSNLVSLELHFLRASFLNVLNISGDMARRGSVTIGPVGGGSGVTPHRPSDATTVAMTTASSALASERGGAPSEVSVDTAGLLPGVEFPLTPIDASADAALGAPLPKKRRTLRQK